MFIIMQDSFDIWKILAGIAIFLLGINFLEVSLKQLAGRRFKLFLRKQTSNKFKAITGGALVTAVLQSSSVVNLMVLAFVGANIITMQNALAIALGANFGTTLDSWIVATVGFKFNIESIAFPITAIGGISMILVRKENQWYKWSYFFLGFGFLFIGLNFMKTGIEETVKNLDLGALRASPLILFLGVGFLVTTLIQSSFATIAITLSALYANAISFPQATAIVLGAEVGTTIKLLLASVKGNEVKKRVAVANFLFNLVTAILVFIFIVQVNYLIKGAFRINDNLIALVFFQSLVNVISIILFLPFLKILGHFLEQRFKKSKAGTLYIQNIPTADIDLAVEAMDQEAKHFALTVISFVLECFDVTDESRKGLPYKNVEDKYDYIKYLHGEIHSYYIQLQKITTDKDEIEKLDSLISSVRNCMYAAKSSKDAYGDVRQLKNSSNDVKYNFYLQAQNSMKKFCVKLSEVLSSEDRHLYFEELSATYKSITNGYTSTLKQLYKEGFAESVNEIEITTLINFNREAFTACKALVFGIKDYLLDRKQAAYFDDLPGFIR